MIDGKILTFVPNKTLPIYNWFYYKEGYSRNFMEYAYEKLNVLESESVLDPFWVLEQHVFMRRKEVMFVMVEMLMMLH